MPPVLNRSRRATVAGVLSVAALAGCGIDGLPAGTAATVGGTSISTDEVQELATALSGGEEPPRDERVQGQRQATTVLVQAELLERLARRQGVEVTQGQVEAQVAEVESDPAALQAAQAQGISREVLPLAVRLQLLQEAVLSGAAPDQVPTLLRDVAEEVGVQVDPRLGEFDDGQVVPAPDELSTPGTAS